ncbi:MdtA/MuxA family multidrug efflux RND transporter periplasmic adaptor subunit [Candidatus Nitrotoga sp. M5]|uniref:MdtA/MuxA family multidrug efflux RND transporter periplasmic adaptor subunit n=1 Tax=Candidatus Nitrotoga sp. M5 TaxID=2890409 RepID=UPI001EF247F7|nr:MdtA/MuxA family multidrug efflux RND transporter periplasmic adaptor subunit [Candidatus Nitrotoga sp. M5]CAH1386687.1 multidrug efflux pump membrane fusion protein MdtA [Candidatus Nitrotoga sp. M5]
MPTNNPVTKNSDSISPFLSTSLSRLGHRWSKRWIVIISILSLAVGGGAIWYASSQRADSATTVNHRSAEKPGGSSNSLPPATPVVVAPVRNGNLEIYLFAIGTVTPLNVVVVRPRVDGQIISIAFKEGQLVKKGDLLAQIDPRPFKMQLTLATGQLAGDQALLDNARADLKRYLALLALDSISDQLVDTQKSKVRQYKAAVQASQGGVNNAKMQLANAQVIAPITGRVGLRRISPGNIVHTSDADGLVVITQLQPVGVVFAIPEDDLPQVIKRLRTGDHIPVDAYDRAQKVKLGTGRLIAADNQIDTTTGTIKLKAEFPNENGTLFANQFVNVRMPVEMRRNATLVPTAAIQHGSAGTFVYVVKDDHTVDVIPVKTGPTQDEVTVIDSGVTTGAMVVINGADRLRAGVKVEIVTHNSRANSGV